MMDQFKNSNLYLYKVFSDAQVKPKYFNFFVMVVGPIRLNELLSLVI